MAQNDRLQGEGRVKQAVKEALTERDISGLKISLEDLKEQIRVGFVGSHQRQDLTNGKVLKARDDINEIKNEATDLKDKVALITKIMFGIGASIGLALLGALMKVLLK